MIPCLPPENVIEYDYDEVWKDKLISFGNTNITYDNIGNPIEFKDSQADVTKQFTWSGRQLETYTQGNKTIEFEYDENGLRHRKTVKENGVIIERYDYVWSEGTLVSQTYTTYSNGVLDSTNTAKFIYDAWGTLQGFVLNDTSTYLYTKNLQGDILSIVNESGQTILTYEYDSWGAVSFSATSMQNLMLAYTLSFVSPFTYRGYCYDYDIELYYLQSRYYSPEIGRFINTDDTQIAIATQGEILGANLFAYCNNNPVMNVDYTGMIPVWAKVSIGIAGIIASVALTIATGGTALPALIATLKVVAGNMAISMAMGALIGYLTGGVSGLKKGLTNGALDGFMWGGIGATVSVAAKLIKGSKAFVAMKSAVKQTAQVQKLIRNASKLKYSKTAMSHINSRPYMKSTLLIQEIMKAAKPVADTSLKNGYKWLVKGVAIMGKSKKVHQGVWELVIDASTNTIVHFLFKPFK